MDSPFGMGWIEIGFQDLCFPLRLLSDESLIIARSSGTGGYPVIFRDFIDIMGCRKANLERRRRVLKR